MEKSNFVKKNKKTWKELFWDLWCTASIVGIWPRFIEPNLVATTRITLPVPSLPKSLEGLKILQISDLHYHSTTSQRFLDRILTKISKLDPDLIVLTGDFICYGELDQPERLKNFLLQLKAPCGVFAIFGNHDYMGRISISRQGDYDQILDSASSLGNGFQQLFRTVKLTKRITERARQVPLHASLMQLLAECSIQVLHNQTLLVETPKGKINVCGLGEYMAGRCDPVQAYQHYDQRYPGIVLVHNPDAITLLTQYPGEIVFSGHTHGGQVNLPWLVHKFAIVENPLYIRGLVREHERWIYISRGLGSPMPFRCFSLPEVVLITLSSGKKS